MEGQKRNHKPGLGNVTEVTDRHVRSGLRKTKDKRAEKMLTKRRYDASHEKSGENLVSLIGNLSPRLSNIDDLRALDKVLKYGTSAEPYFAPSNLYNCQGPWIFPPNTCKIQELGTILQNSQDVTTLQVATNCLINIVSHDDSEWTHLCFPMLAPCLKILHNCMDTKVHEHVYWAMANMCQDRQSRHARDWILENGIVSIIVRQVKAEDWILLQVVSFLFRALFFTHPLPEIGTIAPLWHLLVSRVSEAPDNMVQDVYEAIRLMLRGGGAIYKRAIIQDPVMWPHLTKMHNIESIRILATLSNSRKTADLLVERGVLELYVQMLNHQSAEIRAEGGLGLSNLAESGLVTERLFQPDVLNALQRQLTYTDVFRVRKQVYWFMCSMVTTVPNEAITEFFERGYIKYIVDILELPGELNLKVKALRALERFFANNRVRTQKELEEHNGDTSLNNLITSEDLEIQDLAMRLTQTQEDECFDLTSSQMDFTF